MPRKRTSDSSRFLIVAAAAAVILGLAFAASKWRDATGAKDAGPAAPSQTAANLAPASSADGGAVVDASMLSTTPAVDIDASAAGDAGDAAALDAASVPEDGFVVDRALSPWFIEHHTVDRGVGVCGGMESTTTPRLRYQSDAGAIVRELAAIDDSCPHGGSRTNTVEKTFDYDGDGAPELMIVTEIVSPAGLDHAESAIWTMKGSKILPYQPEAGAIPVFSEVNDVDTDGRPDLLSRLEYTQVGSMDCGAGFVVAPMFVFHSRPGGGFTRTDAVAKKHLDEACQTPLKEALEESGDLASAIVCARVHGQGADAVVHTLLGGCAKFSETNCDPTANDAGKRAACPSWALTLAKQPVPPP